MIHLGIDVGKSALTIAVSDPAAPPRSWPVASIDLEDPAWWRNLRAHVTPGAIIVIEPTGTHYMTPIFTALTGLNCQLWLLNTTTTGKIRAVHISSAKSDRTDAQALALAATWIAQGRPPHGARPYGSNDITATLRQLVNAHASASKNASRALNRLTQLAHALWPALAQHMPTYLKAIAADAVLPDEVRALAAFEDLKSVPGYEHPATRAALQRLAEKLPPGLPAPDHRDAIIALHANLSALRTEIAALESAITAEIEKPELAEVTRRWRTIPSTSDLAIAALHVATHGRAQDFTRDEFRAAAGAHPKRRQSGDHVTARKTKAGYRPAMKNLYLWTLRLLRTDRRPNPVAAYFDSVHTNRRMQAAVGKLARILHAVARDPSGYRVQ